MLKESKIEDSILLLKEELKAFKCSRDLSIQNFLNYKALQFVESKSCNVYLILDEEAFNENKLTIAGYFTLSHKAQKLTDKISNTKRKRITGNKDRDVMHFVLIGHLGKYMNNEEDQVADITLEEIIKYAETVIGWTSEYIPCKYTLVECVDDLYQKGLYDNAGFTYLQNDRGYHQYYKALN